MINDSELAQLLGVKLATIRKWRLEGRGPRWTKLGVLVRYKLSDVDAYLASLPSGGGIAA